MRPDNGNDLAVAPADARFTLQLGLKACAALLLLLACASPLKAEPLGRLFLTPERRAVLERMRQLNIKEKVQEVVEVSSISVNGIVRRSSGKTSVWVNGREQREGDPNTGIAVRPSSHKHDSVTISVGDEDPATLRIGETLNRTTQEKTDGLAGGKLKINTDRADPSSSR